jgi:quinol monooxygenase YgiN
MIVHITLMPGKREEYIKEFKKIAPAVRKEDGCLEYEIYLDSKDPRFDNEKRDDMVIISEKWESIEALQRHSKSPLMESFRKRIKGFRISSTYELLRPAK